MTSDASSEVWPRRGRAAAAAIGVGIDHIAQSAALATLVFGGVLLPGASLATTIFVLASLLPSAVLAFGRKLPGPIFATLQHAPIAVMLPAFAAVGASGTGAATGIATAAAILGLTALAVGAVMIAMAAFDLWRVIRLTPYPVSTGFIAASGLLLMLSAFRSVLTEEASDLPAQLARGDPALAGPALAVAVAALFVVATRRAPGLGLIAVLVVSGVATHAVIALAGIDAATAQSLGLLRGAPAPLGLDTPVLFDPRATDWALVREAAPLMIAAVLISLMGSVLNLSGTELILRQDVPARPALLRLGLGNLVLGGLGAAPSYISLSSTSLGVTIGGRQRATVVVLCGVLALALPVVPLVVALLPPFLAAGLLMFIGATILDRWFLSQRGVSSRSDWLITGMIVVVAVTFGVVTAIALGIVAASMIFAVNYAQLPVVRSTASLAHLRSRVDRGPAQTARLDARGGEVAVVTLQGYLFFGSLSQLNDCVKGLLGGARPARIVILDLRRVEQIDAAAAAVLPKLDHAAHARGGRLVLADMRPAVARTIANSARGLQDARIDTAATIGAALEAVEEELLGDLADLESEETAASAITRITRRPELAEALLSRMERVELEPGTRLIRGGDDSDDVFIIDAGRLSVQAPGPEGTTIHLRSMRAGALVGEVASYANTTRTADVIAETHAVVYRARGRMIEQIRQEAPDLAATWHHLIAVALAEKLHRTNQMLADP